MLSRSLLMIDLISPKLLIFQEMGTSVTTINSVPAIVYMLSNSNVVNHLVFLHTINNARRTQQTTVCKSNTSSIAVKVSIISVLNTKECFPSLLTSFKDRNIFWSFAMENRLWKELKACKLWVIRESSSLTRFGRHGNLKLFCDF